MAASWDFSVLGPVRVRRDGVVIPLRSARQRVLLAVLLLRANRTVSAEELIEHLWGERASDNARARLQTHVTRLRRKLDDRRLIRTVPDGYSIALAPTQLDLSRFRALRTSARQSRQQGDPREEARLLGEALALWRGKLLADVSSQRPDWSETEPIDELRLETVERRNELELERGNHDLIVDELRTLVIEHPLRERFWAQLMLALHRGGQTAQALDTYQRASNVLAEQLGIDPNSELRELHLEVLAESCDSHVPRQVPARTSTQDPPGPLKDKNYNLISVLQQSLENAWRLDAYIRDAENDGDEELARWLRAIQDNNKRAGEKGKELLLERLTT